MLGACTTCMGMYGNGVGTGMGVIPIRQRQIPLVLFRALTALYAAAVGSSLLRSRVRRSVTTTTRASGASASAFGWPVPEQGTESREQREVRREKGEGRSEKGEVRSEKGEVRSEQREVSREK